MSDQYKNVATIAVVVAVAAVAAVALLLVIGDEDGTGAPVVTFKLDDPDKPTYIDVDPHIVKGLIVNDIVVFSNATGKDVTVKFDTATGSPFKKDEILIPAGSGSPFPEADVIIVDPKVVTNYTYRVTAGELSSDHGTEQSPVIRVGPKPSSGTE